ncbi:MAG: hypothetical protein ACTS27_10580 [Phycisphaerales bacterium]
MSAQLQLCAHCGYDLSGIPAPGTCPECAAHFDSVAPDLRIVEPWPCLQCGYPLVDHKRTDRCAECGFPASRSLDTTLMRFQPAAYRKRVLQGALTAALAMVSVILFPIIVSVILAIVSATWGGTYATIVIFATYGLALLAYTIGWHLVLTPPPATMRPSRTVRRARTVSRWAMYAGLVALVAWTALSAIGIGSFGVFGSGLLTRGFLFVSVAASICLLLTFIVFFLASTRYAMFLLERSRSAKRRPGGIAVVNYVVGGIVAFGWLLVLIAEAIDHFARSTALAHYGAGIGIVGSLFGGLGSIVFFFTMLLVLDRIRVAVGKVNYEAYLVRRRTRRTPGNAVPPSPNVEYAEGESPT